MSNEFNWQTEDESRWENVPDAAPPPPPPSRWRIILLILLALSAAGWVVIRQVERRLTETTASIEADILSSHHLFLFASANGDRDLFRSLLSGRNPRWTETQLKLVEDGWLFDRTPFGLEEIPGEAPDPLTADLPTSLEDAAIDLSADLNSAELVFRRDYDTISPAGDVETVTLEYTALYRRGRQRWLNVPLEDAFWGKWITTDGALLTLIYPERDREIGAKLAGDLDHLLAEMCRVLDSQVCSPGLRVQLRLETNPAILADVHDLNYQYRSSALLELPAPTLAGLPVDEAGYQAIYRGYARQMLAAVIAGQMDYTCCEQIAYFQALTDYQLSELGVLNWPVTRQDYQNVILEKANSDTLSFLWRREEIDDIVRAEIWQVYVLVEYLLEADPSLTAADMQTLVSSHRSYFRWLENFLQLDVSVDPNALMAQTVNDALWAYAFDKVIDTQPPPPIPLPDQVIFASCTQTGPLESVPPTILYRFQFDQPEWVALETLAGGNTFMTPLGDDSGVVVQAFEFNEETSSSASRTNIWRANGRRQSLTTDGFIYTFGQMDPTGTRMLVYLFDDETNFPRPGVIEPAACGGTSCPVRELNGLPIWSPDGSDFLMVQPDMLFSLSFVVNGRVFLFDPRSDVMETSLFRAGGADILISLDEAKMVAFGYAPFWIDEQTYGFVQENEAGDGRRTEIFTARTGDDAPERLVSNVDLWQSLPTGKRPFDARLLVIKSAIVHPANPDLFFITAVNPQSHLYLFSFNRANLEVQLRVETDADGSSSISFSPDGRFLILTGIDPEQTQGQPGGSFSGPPRQTLFLNDLADNTTQTFSSAISFFFPSQNYDWTADGQWLLVTVNDKAFDLIAPGYNYQQILPHNLGDCASVAWITP